MTIEERFGMRIRELRKHQQISQEELAFRCNLSKNYVSDVERGTRNITLKVVEKFANIYSVKTLQEIEIYVRQEHEAGYYVINGRHTGSVSMFV